MKSAMQSEMMNDAYDCNAQSDEEGDLYAELNELVGHFGMSS